MKSKDYKYGFPVNHLKVLKMEKIKPYVPPPLPNQEKLDDVVKEIKNMTPEEVFNSSVECGIHNPDGTLTKEYGGRCTANKLPNQEKIDASIKRAENLTPDAIFDKSVELGIHNPDGSLTKEYGGLFSPEDAQVVNRKISRLLDEVTFLRRQIDRLPKTIPNSRQTKIPEDRYENRLEEALRGIWQAEIALDCLLCELYKEYDEIELCLINSATEEPDYLATCICVDLDKLGVDGVIEWGEEHYKIAQEYKTIVIGIIGNKPMDMTNIVPYVNAVVQRPEDGSNWEQTLRPIIRAIRDPDYEDVLENSSEIQGAVPMEEFLETIKQAALPDNDSRKRD